MCTDFWYTPLLFLHSPRGSCTFANDEADFDKKLGTAIGLQKMHEYITGDLTFFCMLAGINAAEIPQTWPDRIKIPVVALQEATYWWYEYRHEALAIK